MENVSNIRPTNRVMRHRKSFAVATPPPLYHSNSTTTNIIPKVKTLPEILFITSFPPRECGIATYSQDLIKALNHTFGQSFALKVCALESGFENHEYTEGGNVEYVFETARSAAYLALAEKINRNQRIEIVLIQHEFGLFYQHEADFEAFLRALEKPVALVFHTVLPNPNPVLKQDIQQFVQCCASIIVMTHNASDILVNDYKIPLSKITVIPHGTHLVQHLDKAVLKEKYQLTGRKVFSTFGLLGSGKSIETTLDAMPAIVEANPDALFLVIGKTHPNVFKSEGEKYRDMLAAKVTALGLENHVKFINQYLPLTELLEYLQLTDIYLFTSKDRNQAVSGTFSYAMSCGCPIISTPIPHAREVLGDDAGIIIDFENPKQLSRAVNLLLSDDILRGHLSNTALQKIASSAWENAAVAHARLFENIANPKIRLRYNLPALNLDHIKRMTTDFGMIQFAKINQPDLSSGYTIDDNARAMIAVCQHFALTGDENDVKYIKIYLNFIKFCQQPEGDFLNYVDADKQFTPQNFETNLSDANGRTIWALGVLVAQKGILPEALIMDAEETVRRSLAHVYSMHSTRAMAFAIKGLHEGNRNRKSALVSNLIKTLADRLVQMYRHESEQDWAWFESYLTYANSLLPDALLCAYAETGAAVYKEIALYSFDFLLSIIFKNGEIKVVSNRGWHHKGQEANTFGEQPIDVAYTILALGRFYDTFGDAKYLSKMQMAFDWFLGKNHLHQILYNPCTGGGYDGLEDHYVNLNQGAESTVSYLMSRLTVEKYL